MDKALGETCQIDFFGVSLQVRTFLESSLEMDMSPQLWLKTKTTAYVTF